ncbi:MAG: hypothetical protein ABJB97_01335 [Acidobacteriota bacterium]
MTQDPRFKRIRERLGLKIPVRVVCRETPDFEWDEVTRLLEVTPFGCGFTLKRPIEKGRLLHMTIPMPRQLRVFDHVEDQYKVWALVRYARPLAPKDGKPLFEVGVAFVGKRAPKSYEEDPSKRYEIADSVTETLLTETVKVRPVQGASDREQTRHNIPIDMLLEIINEKGEVATSEYTVSENISPQGATIFTTLDVPIGRSVRLTSSQYNFTVFAAVRARTNGSDGIPRIHVEFIDREWPL